MTTTTTLDLAAVTTAAEHAAAHLRMTAAAVSVPLDGEDLPSEPVPAGYVADAAETLARLADRIDEVHAPPTALLLRGDPPGEVFVRQDRASAADLTAAAGYALAEVALHRQAAEQAMERALAAVFASRTTEAA